MSARGTGDGNAARAGDGLDGSGARKPADRGTPGRPGSRAGEAKIVRSDEQYRNGPEGIVYAICAYLSRMVLSTWFDYRIHGSDRVPTRGPAILACNHASFIDPAAVGGATSRSATYLARESLFQVPLLGWLIRHLHTFPVARERAAPKQALETCLNLLAKGHLLLMFPEGTRTSDGELGALRRGIVLIARRSGVPVVPARIVGTYAAWPRHRLLPRPAPVRVFFGEPFRYDDTGRSAEAFLGRLRRAFLELGTGVDGLGRADPPVDEKSPSEKGEVVALPRFSKAVAVGAPASSTAERSPPAM